MRSFSTLPFLACFALACAPSDADLTSSALVAEAGPTLDARPVSAMPAARTPLPQYQGANFDFRLELGSANPEGPKVGVYPQRLLVEVDGDWAAVPEQAWDEVREIRYTQHERWTGIWQGSMYEGELTHISLMLEEDAYVIIDDLSYDVAIPADQRKIDVDINLDTVNEQPLVVTVMLDVGAVDGVVTLRPNGLIIRVVDGQGFAHEYEPES